MGGITDSAILARRDLDQDLADRAIEWITGHKSIKPDLPFMMLWASGSMHSPHHAPDSHINKYKGKFDMGWDKAREQILAADFTLLQNCAGL